MLFIQCPEAGKRLPHGNPPCASESSHLFNRINPAILDLMHRTLWALLALLGAAAQAEPPAALPFLLQQPFDENYDLLGGRNYLTPDDNLILDSMTAAEGMSRLKRVETAKENLVRLLNPAVLNQLRAPGEMEKQLYLVLFWLARAYDAQASVEELLEELCRDGDTPATEAQATLKEVLLYNFHIAQHLGVTSFQAEVKLGQGRPAPVAENDDNPQNRLALAIPILPPDRFPQVAHQLFNYELFDGPLPKTQATNLAPSQVEFAQKLISRGLLAPNDLPGN